MKANHEKIIIKIVGKLFKKRWKTKNNYKKEKNKCEENTLKKGNQPKHENK